MCNFQGHIVCWMPSTIVDCFLRIIDDQKSIARGLVDFN